MRKEENEVRKHAVKARMNNTELNQLIKLQRKANEKDISGYIRKMVLQAPVKLRYRNQSADDFHRDMLALKKELEAIGNNLNQAVRKLHLLERIPEFMECIKQYDRLEKTYTSKVEEIKLRMNQLYEMFQQSKFYDDG